MHNGTEQSNLQQKRQDHGNVSFGQPLPFSDVEADRVTEVQFSDQHIQIDNFVADNNDDHISHVLKPPSLDDYPEITFTQIVALDTILNASVTPETQTRTRNPGKYFTSPYVRLSESESSVREGPVYFHLKHPFQNQTGFDVDGDLINEFIDWVYKNTSTRKGRKSAYTVAQDKMEYRMDFGVLRVDKKDWFHKVVHTGRPWEDQHVDVIMYYLRKKAKYFSNTISSYTTVDSFFTPWITNIEKQWNDSNYDMRSISPDHMVGQCIRGYNLLANIAWDKVDNVIIPVNVSDSFHWILTVFRIKHRCLYVYDSLLGGALHTRRVNDILSKLAVMIPLFLSSTGFFGKRLDICPSIAPAYVDKSQSDPLRFELVPNTPQQDPDSNDCGLYACVVAEFISNGVFEIPSEDFDANYYRRRFGTLLWQYGKQKHSEGAISESEVTGSVASKRGGPRRLREPSLDTSRYVASRPARN